MLINFTVKNFKSFKEELLLDLSQYRLKHIGSTFFL